MTKAKEHLEAMLETSRNVFPKRTEVHCHLNNEFAWVGLKRYTHSVQWFHEWQKPESQEMTEDGMFYGPKVVRYGKKRISSAEAKELLGQIDELGGPWAGSIHTYP